MKDVQAIVWENFEQSGGIGWVLLYRELNREEREKKIRKRREDDERFR